jgi:hypothetical protein
MERLKSMFKKREPSSLHYKRKASIVSTNESICDSIYGLTSPKQLLLNDIKNGKPLSVGILNYVLTNFTESEKFDLLIAMNKSLNHYHTLVSNN